MKGPGVQDRFCWHAAAVVTDGDTVSIGPGMAALPVSVIADRPAGAAVQAVFAAAAAGLAFRVGLPDAPPPVAGPVPVFETLTSGSSGAARRIRRTQASWIASFAVNARLFGIGPGVPVAVLGRLVQSLALYAAVEAVHLGAALHLLEGLRPDRQRRALAARGGEVLYATPAQLRLLVAAGGPALPALRVVLVGGAALDAPLSAALADMCPGAEMREFYGAAEASFIALADAATDGGAVGQPYPGVEIALRDAAGAPVIEGEVGAIWVRSPYLFQDYAGADRGGAVWDRGWLWPGDYGRMLRGQLHLAGRAGRMVTVADQNVFPEEIEAWMAGLPGVVQVAVIARPDGLRGHVIEAVLCGDPAAEPALLAACRARFGPLKAPRRLHWRDNWPLLPSGKTDLRALEAGL
ncbi:AMP-binding protein [Fertoebacter nigrum]|uniref:AMP-binding protein n=1 Tax=Fertoeibacter niger TaxID=2656921 RepID=A0A8X8KQE9_9RHOB|nr:AMP-binding protein [Fertoeibacter niger]NUB43987.1 AMP-binding protein [Fertoeibacter niger]